MYFFSFLNANLPLENLVRVAEKGKLEEVEERAKIFANHAIKIIEVANLMCSISNNEDGIKMVRYAVSQAEKLYVQTINAAKVLAAHPKSKVAQENMRIFKKAWENQLKILLESVDDITVVDDFLAVSESHILEDVNKCVIALQEGDIEGLQHTTAEIQGRAIRIMDLIAAEMENYEPCVYTKGVLEAVTVLNNSILPKFEKQVNSTINTLTTKTPQDVDENEFIDASRLVYDGVRDVRRAVLMNRVS